MNRTSSPEHHLRRRGPMIRRVLPPFIALACAGLLVACARDTQQQPQQAQQPYGAQPYGQQQQPYGQPAPTAYGAPPPAAAPPATAAPPAFPFPIPAGFPTTMPSGFPALPGFPAPPPAQLAVPSSGSTRRGRSALPASCSSWAERGESLFGGSVARRSRPPTSKSLTADRTEPQRRRARAW